MAFDPTAPMAAPNPPQQSVPAASPDAPAVGVPDAGQSDSALPKVGTGPSAPPLPANSQVNRDPNAVPGSVEAHHNLLGSIFQDLAGGKKTTWRQTDNGPVAVKENLAPGEMSRNILAAAITGLAGGFSPEARGKGPGGALSAGFEAEDQRQKQNEQAAKNQAQNQFTNQQSADEMTMRKMQNARDQQRSIQEAQEHDLRMNQMQQNLEQGKSDGAERIVEFQQRQADRMNLLSQTGVKPLQYPDGKPVEEFNSPAEAMDWANKNSQLAIHGTNGKYNTIVEVDPHTNRYMIMQKPVGWDDPQWLGVKTKDGVPVKDKDGNYTPDGSFKDFNGKVVAPAGQITPHQMYDSQSRLLETQNKKLTLEETLERLKIARSERAKDAQQNRADAEFDRAGGNPDAIDPKTHEFIVSPSSRTILKQRFVKDASAAAAISNATARILKDMDAGDPEFANTKQRADAANVLFNESQANLLMLSRTPNIADVMSNNLRQQFTKPDGTFDQDGALKNVDSIQMNSGVKQSIREKLTAPIVIPDILTNPSILKQAVDKAQERMQAGETPQQIVQGIKITKNLSENDKDKFIKALGFQTASTGEILAPGTSSMKVVGKVLNKAVVAPVEAVGTAASRGAHQAITGEIYYGDLVSMARKNGIPMDEAMKNAKANGFTVVADPQE